MTAATVLFFILGVAAIAGGIAFIVARGRLSALALRRESGVYPNPNAVFSPTMMLIGGIVLAIVGVCSILAGLFPNG
ncbi:hypothetical protein ACFSBZ_01625 [Amnibacterium flavum]|uniref:Uncharacterized protein n=1 Tax=Amnibacterium flavum TaxID=2173173 RepID=A0A2V1HWB1_9MICO|nr:hypothetical protein [Amnibacterium flavum]PVZ94747.1 hypothetical protein DDQ50_13805 [Amnibacterium flavum]